MKLWSDAWTNGDRIPARFAAGRPDGHGGAVFSDNLNPHLAWSEVPRQAQSLVLICHDFDVPSRAEDVNQPGREVPADLPRVDFFHWVLIDLPAHDGSLAEGEFSRGFTARGKPGPGIGVGDQVDVALPVLLLLIGHPVELVGQGPQTLGQQPQPIDPHRQLPGLGLEQHALGAQDVPQIPMLERVIGRVERLRRQPRVDDVKRRLEQPAEAKLLDGGELVIARTIGEDQLAPREPRYLFGQRRVRGRPVAPGRRS